MKPITTSFGSIRPWQDSDVDPLARHANNRKVSINLRDGFPYPYTQQDARAFLSFVQTMQPQTLLALATPTEAIGGIGLSINKDVHRLTAELGYWLAEPYWGRGIVSEAVALVTDYGFSQLGLVRIYAEPLAHNRASCRVLEKAGFELEGRLRCSVIKEGTIYDQLLYARVQLPASGR